MLTVMEWGNPQAPVLLCLHPAGRALDEGGLQKIAGRFHIITPYLEHSGTATDTAGQIARYVRSRYRGQVYALYSAAELWPVTKALISTHHIHSIKLVVAGTDLDDGSLMEEAFMLP